MEVNRAADLYQNIMIEISKVVIGKEQLKEMMLVELIAGGCHYPGITRAHFYNLLAAGQSDVPLVERVNRFIDDLAADLSGRGCSIRRSQEPPVRTR